MALTTVLLIASCGFETREPLRTKRTQVGMVWVDLPKDGRSLRTILWPSIIPEQHAVIQMSFRETGDSIINVALELDKFLSSKFTDEQVKNVEKLPGLASAEVVADLYWFVHYMSIRGAEAFVTLLCSADGRDLTKTERYREVVRSRIGWTESFGGTSLRAGWQSCSTPRWLKPAHPSRSLVGCADTSTRRRAEPLWRCKAKPEAMSSENKIHTFIETDRRS